MRRVIACILLLVASCSGGNDGLPISDWLASVNSALLPYAEPLRDYGYDNTDLLLHASSDELRDALSEVDVKLPHRKRILVAFAALHDQHSSNEQESDQRASPHVLPAAQQAVDDPKASASSVATQETDGFLDWLRCGLRWTLECVCMCTSSLTCSLKSPPPPTSSEICALDGALGALDCLDTITCNISGEEDLPIMDSILDDDDDEDHCEEGSFESDVSAMLNDASHDELDDHDDDHELHQIGDGLYDPHDPAALFESLFERIDQDHDGYLDWSELYQHLHAGTLRRSHFILTNCKAHVLAASWQFSFRHEG